MELIDIIEELKNPQEYENNSINILDDLNEKEIFNDKIQAIFKRGRHTNLSIFNISQDYYELPERTICANVISITYSNQTISEMFKISIKIKLPWICH